MLELTALPALTDNYIWILRASRTRAVVAVDPGMSAPLERYLAQTRTELAAIVLTHHHPDHIGGAATFAAAGVPIFGPADARIPIPLRALCEGEAFALPGLDRTATVMHVPGHTSSHLAFVIEDVLLCGDTLFSVGCGRVFEGTPGQMLDSLDRLAALDERLRVCAGHEYTESNCRFALTIEPDNADLMAHARQCRELRARGLPTLPSLIALERRCNPFLRVREHAVIEGVTRATGVRPRDPVACFAALRELKNALR
jgi:hydroxyacylglutathione hydrolase